MTESKQSLFNQPPKLFKVQCPDAEVPAAYQLLAKLPDRKLGTFFVEEAALKRLCMAIDLPFKVNLTIEPAFQDEIRNRIADLLLKLSSNKPVIVCAVKLTYLLGVARNLDASIFWSKEMQVSGDHVKTIEIDELIDK